ncbi:MAG: DUF167 domain-containing protein [bacterium]
MQRLKVKITTRAKRNEIVGWQDDTLKIKLKAVPRDGKANEALLDFLAKKWNVSKSEIKIIRGLKSKNKVLEIATNVLWG